MKYLNLIDCTLRDGGYYNNWDFSIQLVNEYLKTMSKVGITNIEIGFRSPAEDSFKGFNWFTEENYLENLNIPKKIKIIVMINSSQIKNNLNKTIRGLFLPKKRSKVYLVRIAFHLNELKNTIKISKVLKNLGYKVAVNLMQISEINKTDLIQVSKILNKTNIDIFYIADSLGGMDEKMVKDKIDIIRSNWKKPFGVHMHNNIEKALSNTIAAINLGAEWIDSTVLGMGRGAGNAQTENLIIELQNLSKKKYNIIPLLNLIKNFFITLKYKYNWGTNPFYYLAGKHGIHPTYIQEMISTSFSNSEIITSINKLKSNGGKKYNIDLIRSDFQKNIKLKNGDWCPKKKISQKEVLLLASGPNLANYLNIIEKYIVEKKPYVIAVNLDVKVNKKLIDAYAVCNPLKIIADLKQYSKISKPTIIPLNLIDKNTRDKLKKIKILNFGVGLKQNTFKFFINGAIIPRLYTLVYALAIATSGKSKKILLAGFDGYGKNDSRTKLVNDLFLTYTSSVKSKKLFAITPTTYTIAYKSIFSLN